jgi:hypothetical protein
MDRADSRPAASLAVLATIALLKVTIALVRGLVAAVFALAIPG